MGPPASSKAEMHFVKDNEEYMACKYLFLARLGLNCVTSLSDHLHPSLYHRFGHPVIEQATLSTLSVSCNPILQVLITHVPHV